MPPVTITTIFLPLSLSLILIAAARAAAPAGSATTPSYPRRVLTAFRISSSLTKTMSSIRLRRIVKGYSYALDVAKPSAMVSALPVETSLPLLHDR